MPTRATATAWSCRAASANPDQLRTKEEAVEFIRVFFEAGKPVGVICHGAWTLVEADVVRGRTLTSWPSLRTDLRNAGAEWVDEEVHADQGLVCSRKPDDLEAFNEKTVEQFAEGVPEGLQTPPRPADRGNAEREKKMSPHTLKEGQQAGASTHAVVGAR